MIKILLTSLILLGFCVPVMAEDINLNSKENFSGFYNQSARAKYPQLKKSLSAADVIDEQYENAFRAKSVKEYKNTDSSSYSVNTPMTYGQFPQNYDSSNMMIMQQTLQQGRNMLMGF